MSLIICPECQHEVSSKAPTCPHCGVQIADNIKRCPVCNTFVLMEARQCPNCKTKFMTSASGQQSTVDSEAVEESKPLADIEEITDDNGSTVTKSEVTPPVDQPSTAPTPHKKESNGSPWWLLVLGILVIAIGGFFYWENLNQEKAEEQAYLLLENCNNPLNFEDFIARFPNSSYIDNVRARLQELQHEKAEWLEVSLKLDVQQLQEFAEQHPNSPYKKVALQKIDSLDWRAADRKGTAAAYDAYITKHDNGEFLEQAFSARQVARAREERIRQDSIAAGADALSAPAQ